jgi:hypothetical protein
MAKNKLAKPKPGPSTQRFLDIAAIRDDMVLMNDGTARAVLLVSSINFALKSADEQEAIVQGYITFLNSFEYPLQIVIQSRKMNIDAYLASLDEKQKGTGNELLKAQIADYKTFVSDLVELGEIMQKRFYVVVPYDPLSDKQKGFFSRLSLALSPAAKANLSGKQIADRREQLERRVGLILSHLTSMGLAAARLDTKSLIELYYTAYNPDVFDAQRLTDLDKVQVE